MVIKNKFPLLILLFFVVVYLLPLAGRPLISPDEHRYGEIPRSMLTSGDFVVPKLNGLRYFEKPAGGYWLNAVSMKIFGANAFALRLPSALAAGLSAMLIYLLLRKYRRDEKEALLGAMIFLSFALVYFIGTFAVLDSMNAFFINACLIAFFCAVRSDPKKQKLRKNVFLALSGIACGGAFLIKGFIAMAVPGLAILAFLIWEKRFRDIYRLVWMPLIFFILTVAPWSIAIHLKEHDFWHYFFVVEHLRRFLIKDETQHPQPFWFYIPIILGGALPWTLLLPNAWRGFAADWKNCNKDAGNQTLTRFFICALVFPFLFFSASKGKLGTYILPCMLPLAILMARGLYIALCSNERPLDNKILRWTLLGLAGAFFLGAIGFSTAQLLADHDICKGVFDKSETLRWVLAVLCGVIWGLVLLGVWKFTSDNFKKLIFFAIAPAAALFMANFLTPNRVLDGKAQGIFYNKFKDRVKADDMLVIHPNVMHSVCWVFNRDNLYLYTHGGETEYGLKYPDAKGRMISTEELHKLLADPKRKKRIIFMMRGDFQENIPPAPFEAYEHELIYSEYPGNQVFKMKSN